MLQLSAMQVTRKQKPLSPKELKKLKAKEARKRMEENKAKNKIKAQESEKLAKEAALHKKVDFREWEFFEQEDFYEEDYNFIKQLEKALKEKPDQQTVEKYQKTLVSLQKQRIANFHKLCPYQENEHGINLDQFNDKLTSIIHNTKVQTKQKQKALTSFDTLSSYTHAMHEALSFEIASQLQNRNPELVSKILNEIERIAEPFIQASKPRSSPEFLEVKAALESDAVTSHAKTLDTIALTNAAVFKSAENSKDSIRRLERLEKFFQKHPELKIQKNSNAGKLMSHYRSLMNEFEHFKNFIVTEFHWIVDSEPFRLKNQELEAKKKKCKIGVRYTNPSIYRKKHLVDFIDNDKENIQKNQNYFKAIVDASIDLYNPQLSRDYLLQKVHQALVNEIDMRNLAQNSPIEDAIDLRKNFKNPIVAEILDYLDKHHEPKESPLRSLFKNWDKFIKAEYGALFII